MRRPARSPGTRSGPGAIALRTGAPSATVGSFAGSQLTIQLMDSALSTVNSARATLGAVKNRFQSVVATLTDASQNM